MAQWSRVRFKSALFRLRPTQKRALEEKPSGARIAKRLENLRELKNALATN